MIGGWAARGRRRVGRWRWVHDLSRGRRGGLIARERRRLLDRRVTGRLGLAAGAVGDALVAGLLAQLRGNLGPGFIPAVITGHVA